MIKKVKKACGYFLYVFLCGWLPHYQLHYKWPISNKLRELAAKLMFEYCGSNVDIGRKISFSQSIPWALIQVLEIMHTLLEKPV